MIHGSLLEVNKIYNTDAFDLLFDLDDESVDLVILDPNYQDWDALCEGGLIVQAVRVLKQTGNILCFTKQPFDFELRNEIDHIFRREIVWTFTNGGAWVSNRMPLVSHQKIYHCVVDQRKSFFNERKAQHSLVWAYRSGAAPHRLQVFPRIRIPCLPQEGLYHAGTL